MAEEPIKLLATRAERYPQPEAADKAFSIAKAVLSAIPVVGGPASELLELVLLPSIVRRRDEWLRDLADVVERLEKEFEGFKAEKLAGDEAFVSATVQATRIAVATHQKEKREMLRNALFKVASGKGPTDDLQQVYFRAIEEFSPSHVRILKAFWTGPRELAEEKRLWTASTFSVRWAEVIAKLYPDLAGQDRLVQHIITDLRVRGFATVTAPGDLMSNNAITNLGIEFLQFVMDENE